MNTEARQIAEAYLANPAKHSPQDLKLASEVAALEARCAESEQLLARWYELQTKGFITVSDSRYKIVTDTAWLLLPATDNGGQTT